MRPMACDPVWHRPAGLRAGLLHPATHILRKEGPGSALARALGNDVKSRAVLAFYVAAVLIAFVYPPLSCALYAFNALVWFIPDRRIDRVIGQQAARLPI